MVDIKHGLKKVRQMLFVVAQLSAFFLTINGALLMEIPLSFQINPEKLDAFSTNYINSSL